MRLIFTILFCSSLVLLKAQETDTTALSDSIVFVSNYDEFTPLDTIVRLNGDTLIVSIKYKDFDQVIFIYPYKKKMGKLMVPTVNELRYNDGVTVIANESKEDASAVKKIEKDSVLKWMDVIEVRNKNELPDGAQKVKELITHYKGDYTTNNEFLENKVIAILKKKAARLNAKYLLIINQDITRSYGEDPYIEMTGEAYSVN